MSLLRDLALGAGAAWLLTRRSGASAPAGGGGGGGGVVPCTARLTLTGSGLARALQGHAFCRAHPECCTGPYTPRPEAITSIVASQGQPVLNRDSFARLGQATALAMRKAGESAGNALARAVGLPQPLQVIADIAPAARAAGVQIQSSTFYLNEQSRVRLYEQHPDARVRYYYQHARLHAEFNLARAFMPDLWTGYDMQLLSDQSGRPTEEWNFWADHPRLMWEQGRQVATIRRALFADLSAWPPPLPPNCDDITAAWPCPPSVARLGNLCRREDGSYGRFAGPNTACPIVYRDQQPSFRYVATMPGTDWMIHPAAIYRYWMWRAFAHAIAPFLAFTFAAERCGPDGRVDVVAFLSSSMHNHAIENFNSAFVGVMAARGTPLTATQLSAYSRAIEDQWRQYTFARNCPPPEPLWSGPRWVSLAIEVAAAVAVAYTGNYGPLISLGVDAIEDATGYDIPAGVGTGLQLAANYPGGVGAFLDQPLEGLVRQGVEVASSEIATRARAELARATGLRPDQIQSFMSGGIEYDVPGANATVSFGRDGSIAVTTDDSMLAIGSTGEAIAAPL